MNTGANNKLRPDQVDREMTRAITEREVAEWIAAKLAEVRAGGLMARRLNLNCVYLEGHAGDGGVVNRYRPTWTISAYDEWALNCDTIGQACADLRSKLPDLTRDAARKRAAAQMLLDEAEALEKAAEAPAMGGAR